MKKNILLLIFLIVLFVSGCMQEKKEDNSSLTILTTGINYEKFVEALNKKYPDINIDFISYAGYNQTGYIKASLEAGEVPDIVTTTYFVNEELQKNRLLDLSKYGFVNNFSDAWLNECNVDGSIYLLPSNYSAIGFYYNKTVMEKYGWQLPNNFEELKELSLKIKEQGLNVCCARMDLEGFIFSYLFGLGNTFFFNTEKGDKWKKDFLAGESDATGNIEEVLSYFKEWVDEGYIKQEDINNPDSSISFYTGETVFMLCNGIAYKEMEIENIGKMEYGILPWLGRQDGSNMIISSVSRYYGLNKNLEEEGNEEKLEDALKVMEFMASDEGMKLLKSQTNTISPLNTASIKEDEMNYEIKDYIMGGNTIPLLYAGWDDLIIPISHELYKMVRNEQGIEECVKAFDNIRNKWLQKGPLSFGMVEEYIDKEEAANIVGDALITQLNADAALISLGEYHGFGRENNTGIQCGIFPGEFTLDRMRTIVPAAKMTLAIMDGKEILYRKEKGKYIQYTDLKVNEENLPYPYVLVTKNDIQLEEGRKYKIVLSSSDLENDNNNDILKVFSAAETQKYLENYFHAKKGIIK